MKPETVELRAIHDLPSPGANAFMDIGDGRNAVAMEKST
jgi:hypothetical protein